MLDIDEKVMALLANLDDDTFSHSKRTSDLSLILGQKMGLTAAELRSLKMGALLHDVPAHSMSHCLYFLKSRAGSQFNSDVVQNLLEYLDKEVIYCAASSIGESNHKYVVFSLENEQYGISISNVREIVKWAKVTRIPQTSDLVCGIRNLRGEIVPIISLRTQFGLPELSDKEDSKIMILEIGDSLFGAVVDSVDEVKEIEKSAIQNPPDSISGQVTSFVHGVAQSENGLTILIDVDKMFTNEEKEEISEAIAD